MNQMACAFTLAPYSSLSPSPSQSHRITSQQIPPPNVVNFPRNTNVDVLFGKTWRPLRQHHCKATQQDMEDMEESVQLAEYAMAEQEALQHMDELCQQGDIEKAEMFLNDMPLRGIKPTVMTYTPLIGALCKKGLIKTAMKYLDDMISKGLEPTVENYNILTCELCKQGKTKMAMDFLNDMRSKGFEPNVVTYSSIIDGLCKEGETEKVKDVLDEMISKGKPPGVVA